MNRLVEIVFVTVAVWILMAKATFAEQTFAVTDKVGQGNFAFAKLFAFADDGSLYRLTKRSAFASNNDNNKFALEHQQGKFAAQKPSEFAFAFAKRNAPSFAKATDVYEMEEVENPSSFAFAKRSKFAFASPNPKFA
uniref:Uncharacterized protein n=1 Tax=Acrobeloides nanus TaxID=290746 RepID=A0A914EFD3_9BILA